MKLYILIGSLLKFQNLFDESAFLRDSLTYYNSNVYFIDTKDVDKLEAFLKNEGIRYKIKND